jgi:hypothetical protein
VQYTSQQYLMWLHQNNSDQAIANEVKYSRETITRIRLGVPGYNGKRINAKLEKIVRQLQAQGPQVVTPVWHPPQVKQAVAPEPDVTNALFEKTHCAKCVFRGLVPFGVSKEQYLQWAKEHPCSNKQRVQCPR